MNTLKAFVSTLYVPGSESKLEVASIYDIKLNRLSGKPLNLSDLKGKYILFVNVASKCGFTSQYEDLQKLYDLYNDKLEIIGLPCNQFGSQEPGSANDIQNFCSVNYGVNFTITEKINVKGKDKHPIYRWLTEKVNNGVRNSSVKWNFQKYLVDPKGNLVDYYFSMTNPMNSKITKYFK